MLGLNSYLLLAALIAAIGSGAWGYQRGKSIERLTHERSELQARANQLSAELAAANAAIVAGQRLRTVVRTEVAEIELQTENSIQIVRADWGRPDCVLPERVQSELQRRIDAANAAASGL